MIGFKYLSVNIGSSVISSYYDHPYKNIYDGLLFFLHNPFYSQEEKNIILHNFYRVHTTRNVLLRAIRRYKIRKHSVNDTDLHMVPLSEHRDNSKIYILENNKYYTFYIPSLLKLWNEELLKSDYMLIEPSELKNPYTNKILPSSTLNYIYLCAYIEMYNIPSAITEYFKVQFNKLHFVHKYGTMLQENAIEKYVTSYDIDLFIDIKALIKIYPDLTFNININVDSFAKKEWLIKDMNHILMLYYYLTHSTNYVKRESARNKFLIELGKYNNSVPDELTAKYNDTDSDDDLIFEGIDTESDNELIFQGIETNIV